MEDVALLALLRMRWIVDDEMVMGVFGLQQNCRPSVLAMDDQLLQMLLGYIRDVVGRSNTHLQLLRQLRSGHTLMRPAIHGRADKGSQFVHVRFEASPKAQVEVYSQS
jgi:hypothetical protein